jgi:hypothetical protein
MNGYSPTGQRADTAPPGWPFGQLDPVQAHRHQRQVEQLQRMLAQQARERADAARRAILANAQEALL